MLEPCYYYLHTNGSLIYKKFRPDPSPFVVRIWEVNLEYRADAYRMLVEAAVLGANTARINSLAGQWGCDGKDGLIFADLMGFSYKEYNGTYEVWIDIDPETRSHGFGSSPLNAIIDYVSQGYFKQNTPHGSFARSFAK